MKKRYRNEKSKCLMILCFKKYFKMKLKMCVSMNQQIAFMIKEYSESKFKILHQEKLNALFKEINTFLNI